MPAIALLLSRYWKPLTLALLVSTALAYRSLIIHQRDKARGDVTRLTAEAVALRASNEALGFAIARQNAAVTELRNNADALIGAMNSRSGSATKAAFAAHGRAADQARALIEAQIDSSSGCAGAVKWGNARAAELSSW
jgi:hypothetical protein